MSFQTENINIAYFSLPRVSLQYVWSHKNRMGKNKETKLFTNLDNFFGKEFSILALVDGRVLQATYLSEEEARFVG